MCAYSQARACHARSLLPRLLTEKSWWEIRMNLELRIKSRAWATHQRAIPSGLNKLEQVTLRRKLARRSDSIAPPHVSTSIKLTMDKVWSLIFLAQANTLIKRARTDPRHTINLATKTWSTLWCSTRLKEDSRTTALPATSTKAPHSQWLGQAHTAILRILSLRRATTCLLSTVTSFELHMHFIRFR